MTKTLSYTDLLKILDGLVKENKILTERLRRSRGESEKYLEVVKEKVTQAKAQDFLITILQGRMGN